MAQRPKYRRVLLKLSGEAFGSTGGGDIDLGRIDQIAQELLNLSASGVQVAVVVGGGNIVRGQVIATKGISSTAGDTMGMLATVINGIALQDVLERLGAATRLQTAIAMTAVAEPFIRRRALRHLEKGRIVILAAGTGHPHFTTDTAAALRAREIEAGVLLKATTVEGVYSEDPKKNAKAVRYEKLTYDDVLHKNLRVMDATAVTLCREGNIPVIVFSLAKAGNIRRAVFGERVGTYIGRE